MDCTCVNNVEGALRVTNDDDYCQSTRLKGEQIRSLALSGPLTASIFFIFLI